MIKQFVPKEVCLKCEGCCRFAESESAWTPCLLDKEISALAKDALPLSMISCGRIRAVPYKKQGLFFFPLLNISKNKCKIYPRRPFECRLYPFIINRKDNKVFLAVDLHCPFAKDSLNSVPFKGYARYLTGLLNSKHYRDILKDNPQIIQKYEEVVNLKELDCQG